MSAQRRIVSVSRALLPHAALVLHRALHSTPYLDGALDALRIATDAPSTDGRALASIDGDGVHGVIVFGFFGGANGAGRLQLIVVDELARGAGAGSALAEEAIEALRTSGARFVLAELPEDSQALPGARQFLESLGFGQESRVEDFYRDGVALSFMRRELDDA